MRPTEHAISTIKSGLAPCGRVTTDPTAPKYIKNLAVALETMLYGLEAIATAQGQIYKEIESLKRPKPGDLRSI